MDRSNFRDLRKLWNNSFKLEYPAYPYFTSIYNKAADCTDCSPIALNWNDFLNYFHGGMLTALKPQTELFARGHEIIEQVLAGDETFPREFDKVHQEMVDAFQVQKKIFHDYRTKDFLEVFVQTHRALSHPGGLLFQIDYALEEYLRDKIEEDPYIGNSMKEHMFGNQSSFILKAKKYLHELADSHSDDLDSVRKSFELQYGWCLNSYLGKHWITDTDIRKMLSEPIVGSSEKSKGLPAGILFYKPLIHLAQSCVTFKDDKKRLQLIAIDGMDIYLRELCDENKWIFEEMRWLSFDEIRFLLAGESSWLDKARQYAALSERVGVMNHHGYTDVPKEIWNEAIQNYYQRNSSQELKGMSAMKGKCSGRVKIVLSPKIEGAKFEEGDILVTSMTKPEFAPLLQKAKAFITDQGGVACHAAIVARELGKPCIIGTKIATKVLKDGDLVEVDAERGVVTIIKKV